MAVCVGRVVTNIEGCYPFRSSLDAAADIQNQRGEPMKCHQAVGLFLCPARRAVNGEPHRFEAPAIRVQLDPDGVTEVTPLG